MWAWSCLQDVITGETISDSIVVNPNDYANIPGLHRRSRSGIFLRTQQAFMRIARGGKPELN